ncbi:hypothetical protein [Candidatus Korobacter versatilis]|nr:hypothetical protein [Candidatus Koribacter versatilis]
MAERFVLPALVDAFAVERWLGISNFALWSADCKLAGSVEETVLD